MILILLLISALLLLTILGAPLFTLIAAVAFLGLYQADADLSVILVEFYRLADMPVLVTIPLFTIAGYVLSASHAPQRLVQLTDALIGWMPGGLGIVALITFALFTAFTGASGATILAMGALLYPALITARYSQSFSLGLITSSGSLGLLFAPSVPLILYAIVAQQMATTQPVTIDAVFKAGILPGILMLVMMGVYVVYKAPIKKQHQRFNWRVLGRAINAAKWELPLPFVVLGSVYSGKVAASEIAAVTALYVILIEVFVLREVSFSKLIDALHEAMSLVGAIMVILGVSFALSYYLIDAGIPEALFAWISEHISSQFTFLLLLNMFLIVLGMLLDVFSATVIMVPIMLPIALQYGIDPIHLGMIFLANMQLGYFTPPVGMSLFIASYRFKRPVLELTKDSFPFFLILLAAVLLITYVPWLSLVLVR